MATKNSKAKVMGWLRNQLRAKTIQAQTLELDGVLFNNFSSIDYLHISNKALRYSANVLEIPLECDTRYDDEYPFKLHYDFEGVTVMALETAKQYAQNGAVE